MNLKKRGLGRGLEDLGLSELLTDFKQTSNAVAVPAQNFIEDSAQNPEKSHEKSKTQFLEIPVDLIHPGRFQPRKSISQDSLEELAQSIRAQGVIQPIVVRPDRHEYEIIAGERRWRAAQLAGLSAVPAIVRDINDHAAMAMALIENIQRNDLNPIEESEAMQRLLEEFQLTHHELAEAVGKSRSAITNLLRLQHLNVDVKSLVEQGQLEMGHARALLALEGNQQSQTAEIIVKKNLSVRATEELIRNLQHADDLSPKNIRELDPDIRRLQGELSDTLGAVVAILHQPKGKGKLVINYNSLEELEGILEHIK